MLTCAFSCDCSERRGQSQKPEEIYQLIEKLVPNGGLQAQCMCEVWITVGEAARMQCASLNSRIHARLLPGPGTMRCAMKAAADVSAATYMSHVCPAARHLPAGKYLEIFGRKNNLRNFWVTIGNEAS